MKKKKLNSHQKAIYSINHLTYLISLSQDLLRPAIQRSKRIFVEVKERSELYDIRGEIRGEGIDSQSQVLQVFAHLYVENLTYK